jgi:hypothetical protein
MSGYIRQDTTGNISTGNIIEADDLNDEFNAVEGAFNAASGHKHDGTSAEGAPIEVVGPAQDVVITTSVMRPKTDNTIDLGTSALKYKDVHSAGTAFLAAVSASGNVTIGGTLGVTGLITATGGVSGSVTSSNATITGGSIAGTAINTSTINGTTIGATTASTGAFTTLVASTSLTTPVVTNAGTLALSATGGNVITASTGGSERLRITTDGRVVIGNNVSINATTATEPFFQLHGTNAGAQFQILRFSGDRFGNGLTMAKSRGGLGTITSVQSGDVLGSFAFVGAGSSAYVRAANIIGEVDGSPSDSSMPGRLVFETTAAGSTSTTERLRINSEGKLLSPGGTAFVGTVATGSTRGAIIERGSNANGEFVRYADGTQIVWGTTTLDLTLNASLGTGSTSPANFVGPDHIPVVFSPTQSTASYSGTSSANRQAIAGISGRILSNVIRYALEGQANADPAALVAYSASGRWF